MWVEERKEKVVVVVVVAVLLLLALLLLSASRPFANPPAFLCYPLSLTLYRCLSVLTVEYLVTQFLERYIPLIKGSRNNHVERLSECGRDYLIENISGTYF